MNRENATLYCVGRDIENREIALKFDSDQHRWISDEILSEKENKNKVFIETIFDFMVERKNFVGTATELVNLIAPRFETEIFPNRLTRDLVQNAYELSDYGIKFSSERSHGARRIRLELLSGDGSDSKKYPSDFTDLPSPEIKKAFCNTLSAGDGNFRAQVKACAPICARFDRRVE